jgi:polysaccharide export outer membrane protein
LRFLINFFIISGVLLVFSSCSNKQYQTLFEQRTAISDTSSQKSAVTLDSYHIQPQDVLQIRNLQNMSYIVDQPVTAGTTGSSGGGSNSGGQTYQVEEDGTVGLPVIGRVPVVGLTRSEAQKKVETLYKDSVLRNPIIELKIVNLKVTLLGEVKAQGNIPLVKDKTTLVEIIGQAGGLTDRANETNIKIIRGDEKNPKVIIADLNDIKSINDPNNVLQNGDIIYVSQNKRAVRNDNIQNFSTISSPILLLLNTALIILSLSRR